MAATTADFLPLKHYYALRAIEHRVVLGALSFSVAASAAETLFTLRVLEQRVLEHTR